MHSNLKQFFIFGVLIISIASFSEAGSPVEPNLGICRFHEDIFNVAGQYIKSVCVTASRLSLTNANNLCQTNSMSLLEPRVNGLLEMFPQYFPQLTAAIGTQYWATRDSTSCYLVQNVNPWRIFACNCNVRNFVICEYKK